MNKRYKIILSSNSLYKEIELAQDSQRIKVGTSLDCDIRLRKDLFFGNVELFFVKNEDKWSIHCSDNLYLTVGDIRKLMTKNLVHGDSLEVKYQESDNYVFSLDFLIDFNDSKKEYDRVIDLSGISSLTIGCASSNNIALNSPFVKNDALVLSKKGTSFVVDIKQTTYGVYINGKKAQTKEELRDGDFLSISDFFFYYKSDELWAQKHNGMKINSLHYVDKPVLRYYPKFNRNTRIKTRISDEKIEILDPPAKPQKPKNDIISRLLPSVVMVVAGLAMSFVSPFMLISSGLGIVTAIVGLIQGHRDFKKNTVGRIEKYNAYIESKRTEIEEYRKQELSILEEMYISPAVEQDRFMSFSSDLFDRNQNDDDFLCVRLGTGDLEAKREVNFKKQERLEIEDELQELPEKVYNDYKYIHDAPIVCDLKNAGAMGVFGSLAYRFEILKNIVIDLAARHYYSDVKMIFVAEQNNKDYINWIRFLPHVYNDDLGIRNIVCDAESKNIIFEYLYKELTLRESQKKYDHHIVAFFFDEYGIKSHPISKFINKAKDLGVTFVFFADSIADIPLGCRSVIAVKGAKNATLIDTQHQQNSVDFAYPTIPTDQAEKIINLLAPVYTEEISLEGTLTKNISLFELLNILAVDDIDLQRNWASSQVFKSMSAPLGVSKTGVVSLDLHDKAHGPHGLVAGTTGSGKSEILQTYILAMATLFHPHDVGFLIIDFKGGGMVNQFKDLPHLLGAITNIDGKEIDRSLKSIKAELQKRQRLFAEADVNHIDKYIKKYKAGDVSVALPHLIIIVDEFAELKAEQPEFMKELISAARIGRSLGVHLILATQKPSGQVNEQIWSNSRFKLCLKVQSQEDSNEVIKSPLAAEIKEPGRAYLQVGNNEIFELFQSAYSGASEKADASNVKEFAVYNLTESGRRVPVYVQKKQKGDSGATQLEAIVNYVSSYCNTARLRKLPDICLPPLKKFIEHENVYTAPFSIPIGVYDDPDNQLQEPFAINIFSENTIVIGSSMTGKTNLLQLVIRGIASTYSPEEVSVYIVDFASMVLKNFEKLNHVGGVVVANEEEKLKNLFKLLNEEISQRKEKILTAGVSNFLAYKEAGYSDLAQIVLIIDNLTALKEMHFSEEDFLLPLCREGLSVGISVVIANSQTAGIGYKYFSCINQRIALSCNDSTEYSAIFDRCKIQPENIPGRCLVQKEKEIFEAQTYISFKGEKEFERVQSISMFIEEINKRYTSKAKKIPVVPDILLSSMAETEYGIVSNSDQLFIGVNFANVAPTILDFARQDVLVLSGSHIENKNNFINYLKKSFADLALEMYILDDYSGIFSDIAEQDNVFLYSKKTEDLDEMLLNLKNILVERYAAREMKGIDALQNMRPIVLVINTTDAAGYISENRRVLETYKEIVKKYKNLKSLILFTNIENEQIVYGSPEVLKMMKDNYQFIMFEDLNSVKLFDCPLSLLKKFKAPLKDNEAYFLSGNELKKIKTVLH